MNKEREKRLSKYIASLEDRLHATTRGALSKKHLDRDSGASLKQFLEREIASAKASLATAKGL
jgi:hypothetical protein